MGLDYPPLVWAAIGAAIFVAGLSQGALGFGFPAISTPVLALMTDIKTAVLLNLLPNMTVNVISVIQGGNWRASLGVHWPVAVYALIGSFIGASVLILAPQEPLRLLLAAIILVYLYQKQIALLNWNALMRRPRLAQAGFGLTGGFFSGSVNNSLPPLLIYFMLLGVETVVMTQMLNLCFLGGKMVQAATLAGAGELSLRAAAANVPLTLVALAGMAAGQRMQRWMNAATYQKILRYTLMVIALVLTAQGMRYFFR
jgi:uncharacterized membrane protein YfcA